jgi:hypothetical protein
MVPKVLQGSPGAAVLASVIPLAATRDALRRTIDALNRAANQADYVKQAIADTTQAMS